MTDPAPTAEDVLAAALLRADLAWAAIAAPSSIPPDGGWPQALASAAVAAIRDMTAEQQADLLAGTVWRVAYTWRTRPDRPGRQYGPPNVRVLGPWRAEP